MALRLFLQYELGNKTKEPFILNMNVFLFYE